MVLSLPEAARLARSANPTQFSANPTRGSVKWRTGKLVGGRSPRHHRDPQPSTRYPTRETGGKGEAGTGMLVGGWMRKHNPLSPGRFALLLHHHEIGPAVEERLLACVRQDGDEEQKSDATAALKHQ